MDFGPLFITAGIAQAARDDVGFLSEILECLRRYQLGDWGDLCPEDMQLNEAALRTGARLMGCVYHEAGRGRSGSSLKQQMTTARELPRPSFSLTSIETGVQL